MFYFLTVWKLKFNSFNVCIPPISPSVFNV